MASVAADRPVPAGTRETFDAAMHWVTTVIEVVGVAVIVVGAVLAAVHYVRRGSTIGWQEAYKRFRAELGRAILLGLEFLVAADIIGTVAVTPTFESLGVLAAIVLIRTFLSFSLEVEIEGRWPWQRSSPERSSAPDQERA